MFLFGGRGNRVMPEDKAEAWPSDEVELHNSYARGKGMEKLPFEGETLRKCKRELGWKVIVAFIPIVNIALTPIYMTPQPENIRSLLQTTMIVNGLAIGRIFLKEDLDGVAPEVQEEYMAALSGFSKVAINAFALNVILLAVATLAQPSRGRRRYHETWWCLRFGVVVLIWLDEFYLIFLFMLYSQWGKVVYGDERFLVFATVFGSLLYGLIVLLIVIATIAIPGEVFLDATENYRVALRKRGEDCCPFISSLSKMPATQSQLALQGLTYTRLRPYKDNAMMLLKIFEKAHFSPADCLDLMQAVQSYRG